MLNKFSSSVSSLLDARAEGHSLPAGLYTDSKVFEADLDIFFRKHWIYVGLECDVPEAGGGGIPVPQLVERLPAVLRLSVPVRGKYGCGGTFALARRASRGSRA